MLTPKNNANQMRTRILVKIVEKFLQNRFNDADRIPLELRPKGEPFNRCCIYKDRAILKYRCMAGMGFAPEDEKDELTTLREYGEQAMARTRMPAAVVLLNPAKLTAPNRQSALLTVAHTLMRPNV